MSEDLRHYCENGLLPRTLREAERINRQQMETRWLLRQHFYNLWFLGKLSDDDYVKRGGNLAVARQRKFGVRYEK